MNAIIEMKADLEWMGYVIAFRNDGIRLSRLEWPKDHWYETQGFNIEILHRRFVMHAEQNAEVNG